MKTTSWYRVSRVGWLFAVTTLFVSVALYRAGLHEQWPPQWVVLAMAIYARASTALIGICLCSVGLAYGLLGINVSTWSILGVAILCGIACRAMARLVEVDAPRELVTGMLVLGPFFIFSKASAAEALIYYVAAAVCLFMAAALMPVAARVARAA